MKALCSFSSRLMILMCRMPFVCTSVAQLTHISSISFAALLGGYLNRLPKEIPGIEIEWHTGLTKIDACSAFIIV